MGIVGKIIAALLVYFFLNMFSGMIDPFIGCLLGFKIGGFSAILAVVIVFFPSVWGMIMSMFGWLKGVGTKTKQGIETAVPKGNWRIVYGIIGLLLVLLRFTGIGIFNANNKICVYSELGISIILLVWGIWSHFHKKKKEGIEDFAFIGEKREEEIKKAEEYISKITLESTDMRTVIEEFTELTKYRAKELEAERTNKPVDYPGGFRYADLEESYKATKTELRNALIKNRKIIGAVFAKSKEKLAQEGLKGDEIKRIQASMVVGALTKSILKGKKGTKQYEYRDWWA